MNEHGFTGGVHAGRDEIHRLFVHPGRRPSAFARCAANGIPNRIVRGFDSGVRVHGGSGCVVGHGRGRPSDKIDDSFDMTVSNPSGCVFESFDNGRTGKGFHIAAPPVDGEAFAFDQFLSRCQLTVPEQHPVFLKPGRGGRDYSEQSVIGLDFQRRKPEVVQILLGPEHPSGRVYPITATEFLRVTGDESVPPFTQRGRFFRHQAEPFFCRRVRPSEPERTKKYPIPPHVGVARTRAFDMLRQGPGVQGSMRRPFDRDRPGAFDSIPS